MEALVRALFLTAQKINLTQPLHQVVANIDYSCCDELSRRLGIFFTSLSAGSGFAHRHIQIIVLAYSFFGEVLK